jgi:hypothetical protein
VNFDSVFVSDTAIDSFAIHNRSGSTVTVGSMTITGNDSINFDIESSQVFTVDAGDSQFVRISFTPNSAGGFHATLNVYSDGGIAFAYLSGIGVDSVTTNSPPQLTSATRDTAYVGALYEYVAEATDPEASTVTFSFEDYPHWLSPSGSSISGTPAQGTQDTSFVVIATDGELKDTLKVSLTVIDNTTSVKDIYSIIPATFCLKQNYPNPFNPLTTIVYGLPENSVVAVTIYNIAGQKIGELYRGKQTAGMHRITWNAAAVSSGTYFIKMQAKNFIDIKKCILLK